MNDSEIFANTLTVPSPYTEKEANDWMKIVKKELEEYEMPTKWVVRHEKDGLIGSIGNVCNYGVDTHVEEIGYWLAAPYRGQGLMTTIVKVYSDWLFANTQLIRLEAHVFAHNPASVRVLEKAGFEQEGFLRKKHKKKDRFLDSYLFAKIKD